MKRKRITALGLASVMLMSVTLSACGSGADESRSSDGNIVITVASRYATDVEDEKYYRQKVEEFNKMDNGITVEMDNVATESDYLDKLRTAFANGDTPNVFLEYGGSRTLDYLETDALVDLKPYLEENDSEWYNTFYESLWDQTQYDGYDGIYAVPFKSYMVLLFYNKDLFEQAGLEAPVTIDDMLDACAKFKEMGIKPFQVGEKDNFRFGHFNNNLIIKTLGVDAVDELANRELSYDSDEMINTYKIIEEMVANDYFGENILDTDQYQESEMFLQGDVAMHWDGTWFIPNYLYGSDIYDSIGVVPFPYGDEKYASQAQGGSSDMWYVSKLNKSDEEIEASVEFLKYITSPEYYTGLDEVAQTIYPVKYEKSDNAPENPLLDEALDIYEQVTDMRTDVQNYDPDSRMLDAVRSSLQGLAMGNSAEECAEQIMETVNAGGGE